MPSSPSATISAICVPGVEHFGDGAVFRTETDAAFQIQGDAGVDVAGLVRSAAATDPALRSSPSANSPWTCRRLK